MIEKINEKIYTIEEKAFESTDLKVIEDIKNTKSQLARVGSSVKPLLEIIMIFSKADSKFIKKAIKNYYRDVYDHTAKIIYMVDAGREELSDIMDISKSNINLKQNEIMKILTIISTIFIPLTFIVGVYGMNFQHMPELGWRYGYYLCWLIMGIVTLIIIYKIRKMGWI